MSVMEDPVLQEPDFEAIGRAARYFLEEPPTWILRHVETVVLDSERTGRRHLTIDVCLPRDGRASLGEVPDGSLYYIPISMLRRDRLSSQFDFVDEHGTVLPLLTRDENTAISWYGLAEIFERRNWLYDGIDDDLQTLLLDDQEPNVGVAAAVLTASIPPNASCLDRLARVISDLAANSLLWVPLAGRPGQRRVVKLSYPVALREPVRVKHVHHGNGILVDSRLGEISVPMDEEGGLNLQRTAAEVVERAVSALGWLPYRTTVEFPQLRGSHSYHLQVVAPEGVEVDPIECGGEAKQYISDDHCDARRAHLYLSDAPSALKGQITCSYRPERRGFLNWALVASIVAAGGLWLSQSHVPGARADTDQQIAAAVLLVLPALLVVLVIRQAEHPVATRLLSGVRALLMVSGLASVTAAAALAGIRPDRWQTISEDWIWCAAAATLALIGVMVAWLASFGIVVVTDVAPERSREEFLARTFLAALAAFAVLEGVRRNLLHVGEAEPVAAFLLVSVGAAIALSAIVNTRVSVRALRAANLVLAGLLIGAAATIACVPADTRTNIFGDMRVGAFLIAGIAAVVGPRSGGQRSATG